ncbi:MAG: type I 3-dehydroquinate dehydratase [Nitrososphaeria archaeon]
MQKPKLCTVLTKFDERYVEVANRSDIVEVRIDMIGNSWTAFTKMIKKPWIACNRSKAEGGYWERDEESRVRELLRAITFGAAYIDIELNSPNVIRVVENVKECGCKALISYHNFDETPSLNKLKEIFEKEVKLGADVCKIVTTAKSFQDNLTIFRLIMDTCMNVPIVAFCMGEAGVLSRVLSPFFGGMFTYASIGEGLESAKGQIDLESLESFYNIFYSREQ